MVLWRIKEVREARQISHYFMRKYTNLSLIQIGKETRNDHSSVIHSLKVVPLDMSDRDYRSMVEAIETQIKFNIKN